MIRLKNKDERIFMKHFFVLFLDLKLIVQKECINNNNKGYLMLQFCY